MCVIAFSPKGVEAPTDKQLEDMWATNPDGAGFAYVDRKGRVVYRKGFMTLDSLKKALGKREKFTNTNFAIHFRIGTSGKNDPHTCHPFPVSNNFGDLRKTKGKVDAVLFHNGIIADGGLANELASDTQDFVIATFPLFQKYNKSKCRDYFIEKLVSGNRVLVMYGNGKVKMYGEWKKDGDLLVSNTHYQWKSYSSEYGLYSGYSLYDYGYDYNYDYKDDKGGDSSLPEYPHFNFDQVMTDEARKLWGKIVKNEYAYVSPHEVEVLKQSSMYYSKHSFEADGYKLGYDKAQELVWVEDTPPTAKTDEATEAEQVELLLAEEEKREEVVASKV